MSKDSGYYDAIPLKHAIQEMFELPTKKSGENYCCCHKPPLVILLDHIILDELHLMLRITDILIENLIEDAMQWGDKESSSSTKKKISRKVRTSQNPRGGNQQLWCHFFNMGKEKRRQQG